MTKTTWGIVILIINSACPAPAGQKHLALDFLADPQTREVELKPRQSICGFEYEQKVKFTWAWFRRGELCIILSCYTDIRPNLLNSCTCAFAAGVLSLRGAEEPAVKVFFPELGEPHVPAIVLKGERRKVFIKPWEERKEENG